MDALARLMAPLLPFTADEIWEHMPGFKDKAASIHLTWLPAVNSQWQDESLAQRWEKILQVRAEATKALEEARVQKRIGHPLDAAVTISAKKDLYDVLKPYAEELRFIFIVSKVTLLNDEKLEDSFESENVAGLFIKIGAAAGEKCEQVLGLNVQRFWVYGFGVPKEANRLGSWEAIKPESSVALNLQAFQHPGLQVSSLLTMSHQL